MTEDLVVLVGNEDDEVLTTLSTALGSRGVDALRVGATRLAGWPIAVTDHAAATCGRRISAVVFRARRDQEFSDGFERDDQSFASSEAWSLWLHVLSLPTVTAINRADPETWFSSAPWWRWRERLRHSGVPVAPVMIGDTPFEEGTWIQWAGGERPAPRAALIRCAFLTAVAPGPPLARSTICCGEVVDGPTGPSVMHAVRVLDNWGVKLAALGLDSAGRVVAAETCPHVDAHVVPQVAELLAREVTR